MSATRVWPETFPQAVADHVRAILIAEREALERDCADALRLTPPMFWGRLIIVAMAIDPNRPHIPPAVACTLA